MRTRRSFLKSVPVSALLLTQAGFLASCSTNEEAENDNDPFFKTRGLIIGWDPEKMLDWPRIAYNAGLTTLGVTISGSVKTSEAWIKFVADCKKYNIQIQHPQHAMSSLLPRDLFSGDPTMFRMNEKDERTPDCNCCTNSKKGLEIIADNALKNARAYPSTTGKYFFWMDDGGKKCNCPADKHLSPSDQALIVENAIIKKLRQENSTYTVAHLAYHNTIPAPSEIRPGEGIFLQFAPFERTWDYPINDPTAKRAELDIKNADYLTYLDQNLQVFPVETAEILEYWLDDSLFSNWAKPAQKLPWNKEVFLSDIDTYAKRGIRNIVSFAVYIDQDYLHRYKDIGFIDAYGKGLKHYKL
jgi:hypothetical protein